MKICLVIPVHNESSAIGPLIEAIRRKNLDVVVIDDGSSDRSGEIASQKGAKVLRNTQRSGKGFSLQRGFDYAMEQSYEAVIAMDGDGQHDAGDLDCFIDQAQIAPVCIIAGNRMHNVKDMPWLRCLTNRGMSWLISCFCHQPIPDTQCGYRYIHSKILKEIHLSSSDFEIETEVLIQAAKKGFKIYSVPIKTIYRDEESKIHPLKDTIRFFRYLFKEITSQR